MRIMSRRVCSSCATCTLNSSIRGRDFNLQGALGVCRNVDARGRSVKAVVISSVISSTPVFTLDSEYHEFQTSSG